MRLNKTILLLAFFTISLGKQTPRLISITSTEVNASTKEIHINFTVPKKDFVYKDFITCSIDNPYICISPWKANKATVAHYDSSFKEAKQVFNEDFTLTLCANTNNNNAHSALLYCSYYRHADKKIKHIQFPLTFAAIPSQINEMIDTITTIDEYEPIQKIRKTTILEYYSIMMLHMIQIIIKSLHNDHKKYFALLLFFLSVLIAFFYFFKEELQKQIKVKEWLEIIISVCAIPITMYILMYIYIISTALITLIMACICTLSYGLFYTKKSTKVQSKNLRTLCTILGTLCISSTLLLSFKALQYADAQCNLF